MRALGATARFAVLARAPVSPDGRGPAFSSARNGSNEIHVADTRAGRVRRLTGHRAVEPARSPAGTQIAYASNRDGRNRVWADDAAGGEPLPLVGAPGPQRAPSHDCQAG